MWSNLFLLRRSFSQKHNPSRVWHWKQFTGVRKHLGSWTRVGFLPWTGYFWHGYFVDFCPGYSCLRQTVSVTDSVTEMLSGLCQPCPGDVWILPVSPVSETLFGLCRTWCCHKDLLQDPCPESCGCSQEHKRCAPVYGRHNGVENKDGSAYGMP